MERHKSTGDRAGREVVSQDLIEACRAGDQRAWEAMVDATHRDVYTLCLRILRDPSDAQEATQDTYLKVWRSLSGFRGEAMFSTWLYRVASNTAISKHRKRKRRQTHEAAAEDEVLAQVPSGSSTEGAAGARIEMDRLEEMLALLAEDHREVIILRDVYGLSTAEVAKRLGLTETAAKVRLHRARKKLKDMMLPDSPGTDEAEERR